MGSKKNSLRVQKENGSEMKITRGKKINELNIADVKDRQQKHARTLQFCIFGEKVCRSMPSFS